MKNSYILGIIMIIAAVFVFMSASKDVSSYATFSDAMASQSRVKISGVLAKDKAIVYNPEVDANSFSFHMIDSKGKEQKVVLTQTVPQDFERSEQVVVTGSMKEDFFLADEVLLKCPSKYKEQELSLRDQG